MPMMFGPPWINVYLLPCPGGWMLIDTGMSSEESYSTLSLALAETGVAPEHLRHIVLTHMHPDHCGLALQLRDISGAEVWMHRADADLLTQLKTTDRTRDQLETAMREAGTPPAMRNAVLESHARVSHLFPALSLDHFLEDGLALESWVGPLEVVWTPGHSPGHCCLYARDARLLFSSDHVIEDITPHVGWMPGEDMLGLYLQSLDRLEPFDVERILPAHGLPFTGLSGWIAQTRNFHARRLEEIDGHLKDGARTADDLVRRLWPRDLRPLDYQLAVTEVLAYLEHARRKSRIPE